MLIGGWWLVAAVGFAAVVRDGTPARALGAAPWDARAHAAAAEQAVRDGKLQGTFAQIATVAARAALRRDPTLVGSWRTLGLVAASRGDAKLAEQLFAVAERRSRRDLPTQLWIIEDRVRRGDVAGALRHYDIALRTNADSYDMLLPILVAAAGDPLVAPALGRLLQGQPDWANNYYYRLSQAMPTPAVMLNMLEVARRAGPLSNPEMLAGMIPRLVDQHEYDAAMRMFAALSGTPAHAPKGVWNGGFTADNRFPPLDWSLADAEQTGAELRDIGQGRRALVAFATGENGGTAARQILILTPGRYRLSVTVKATDRPLAALRWRLACASGERPALVDGTGGRAGTQPWTFQVPAGCPAQWLSVDVTSTDPGGSEAAVERVSVTRAG